MRPRMSRPTSPPRESFSRAFQRKHAGCWPVGHLAGWKGPSGFSSRTTAEQVVLGDKIEGEGVSGKVAVVTGGNAGVGYETALALALGGAAAVVLACRDPVSGKEAVGRIYAELAARARVRGLDTKGEVESRDLAKTETGSAPDENETANSFVETKPKPEPLVCCLPIDLESFVSVGEFMVALNATLSEFLESTRVDLLIHNAGIMPAPCKTTMDGHERTAQVNFLAPFLLTRLLLPNLQQSPDGPDALNRSKQRHTTTTRVVFVSSAVHRFSYPGGVRFEERDFSETNRSAKTKTKTKKNHDPVKAYGESKLCLVLLARMLAVVFSTSSSAETNCAQTSKNAVHFHSLHPGAVRTKGSERARLQSGGWLGAVVHFLGKPFLKVRPFQLPKSIPPPRLRIGRTHTVLSLTLVTVQIDYPSLLSIHRPIHAQYTPNKWTDGFFYRYQSAQAGAATTVRCCQMSDYESFQKNGGYHVNCELRKPSAHALDVALGRKTVRHAIQETNPYVVGHDCFSAQLRSGKYGF